MGGGRAVHDTTGDEFGNRLPKGGVKPGDKIAFITMVYNESLFLPLWLKYYGQATHKRSLYVVNHGSNDGSIRQARQFGASVIHLPREFHDNQARTGFISTLHQALLHYYDWVIYTDCDEFIIPDPNRWPDLRTYLVESLAGQYDILCTIGLNTIHAPKVEGKLDLEKPLLGQRRFCYFGGAMCKPLISRVPVRWSPGFHGCDSDYFIDRSLYLFHMKRVDLDYALKRLSLTRTLEWSDGALARGEGRHQRVSDQQFIDSIMKKTAVLPSGNEGFHFDEFLDKGAPAKQEPGILRGFDTKLTGELLIIPERFYGII